MSDNKTVTSTKKRSKINSSLVLKLNVAMLWRLICSFAFVNILIILLSSFLIFWKVEEGINIIINTSIIAFDSGQHNYSSISNYQISKTEGLSSSKGFIFPKIIEKILPLKNNDFRRSITIDKPKKDIKLLNNFDLVRYSININLNEGYYQIIYPLGSELKLLLLLFSIVLVFELLTIIRNLQKGVKNIRKALKPLSDLADTARSLNAEVLSTGLKSEGKYIKDIAGVISSIDANKLDSRISVDSSQNELKDLASAINEMLNRINDSYQSQMRFVSDASHELRTPISVIQGYANLLDRWGKNDEKTMQESIDAIKSESESMKDLVEQLLFLARGDNETIQLHREEVDICEIMDEIIKETQMIDSDHNFDLCLNRPAYINVDKQLIKQVVRILVDNSIKYTPHDGKILLRIEKVDDLVHITVQDSGIGIDPEDLANIFDRFYRSDESRARKTGGSGLGLSIAKWVIEKHDGHFEILSRVDIGTRITIIIPSVIIKDLAPSLQP